MPKTAKGQKILNKMRETYPTEAKAQQVFHASKNTGRIKGVEAKGKGSRRK